ncbi:NUDIX domain-containing protein, partial [bacterium]|nr:NUDIX domain-containing protein [candidate division CSSED10-310 bacterium]
GRTEPDKDPDMDATIRREVREELGIELAATARFMGRADDVRAVGRGRRLPLIISVFVYQLIIPVEPRPNQEVVAAMWIPVAALLDENNMEWIDYMMEGDRYRLPAIRHGGRLIWGLTYRMLDNIMSIAGRPLSGDPLVVPEELK